MTHRVRLMLSPVLCAVVLVSACQSAVGEPAGASPDTQSANAEDADRLEVRLEHALGKFGRPATDENREAALVFLTDLASSAEDCDACNPSGILDRMLELPASQNDVSFEDAARFALAELVREGIYEDRS